VRARTRVPAPVRVCVVCLHRHGGLQQRSVIREAPGVAEKISFADTVDHLKTISVWEHVCTKCSHFQFTTLSSRLSRGRCTWREERKEQRLLSAMMKSKVSRART